MNAHEEQSFENLLQAYGRRQAFRRKLNRIHTDMEAGLLEPTATPRVVGVRHWWQTYRTTLAIAASVAVFTTFGTILLYRSYQESQRQDQQYSMLRRDMMAIRSQQKALLDINGRGQVLQRNPGQVGGTGFLLTPDGYFVTNNHIVQDADSVYVQSRTGTVYKARIVHTNPAHDLAILQLCDDHAFRPMPPVPYSFTYSPSDLGERVFTLGYPREEIVYGEGYLSAATGYRNDSTAYQVAISVNPGNSGGPLLDERGNVVGIITGKQTSSEGASFAVKTHYLLKTIAEIPADSLKGVPVALNHKTSIGKLPRTQQIKRMEDYVYQVKVFKH